MFWRSPSGRTAPALATHLKALHAFEEDLKEGLGLPSLYNESLGTTSDLHCMIGSSTAIKATLTSPGNKTRQFVGPAYFEYSSWLFSRFILLPWLAPEPRRAETDTSGKSAKQTAARPTTAARG